MIKKIKITLIIIAILAALFYLGLLYFGKKLKYLDDVMVSSYVGYSAEMLVAKKHIPYGKEPRRSWENFKDDRCSKSGQEDWYESFDIDKCSITRGLIQANDYCWWFALGETCVGLAVPEKYVKDNNLLNELVSALTTPCQVFYKRKIKNRDKYYNALSCQNGSEYLAFDVFLLVIRDNWQEVYFPKKTEDQGVSRYLTGSQKSVHVLKVIKINRLSKIVKNIQ